MGFGPQAEKFRLCPEDREKQVKACEPVRCSNVCFREIRTILWRMVEKVRQETGSLVRGQLESSRGLACEMWVKLCGLCMIFTPLDCCISFLGLP